MKFYEKKTDAGYEYAVHDVFGEITINSTKQLTGKNLDDIVVGILKANTTVGNVTPTISFVFNKRREWEEDEKEKPTWGMVAATKEARARLLTGSSKSRALALAFALILGTFGIHRFYVGKNGTGLIQLLCTVTLIGLFVSVTWSLLDALFILFGGFTDKDGRRLANW